MNNSKLVNVLRTFSKNEMKEFEKLVSSPFFNGGRNYIPFLRQLKKFYPKFDDNKMTPEYIYSKLHPGKKFNKQIIWNMNSALLSMAEEYLMHVFVKKNAFEKNMHIAEEFLNRNLSVYSFKKLDEIEKGMDLKGIDHNYFVRKMQLESERIECHFYDDNQHLITDNLLKQGGFTIVNFIKDIANIISDMNSNMIMYNDKFDINIPYEFMKSLQLEKVIEYAGKNNFLYADILKMYYCYIMIILKPDEEKYFFTLKNLIEQNFKKFTPDENHIWTNVLSNYCAIKGNAKHSKHNFNKIMFEIHNFQLKESIAFPERNPSKTLFIQIIKNALSINEIEWVKIFIEEYVLKLRSAHRESMRALGYSYLYFKLKDYNKVLENLSKVKFTDVRLKINTKSLYLLTFYELNDVEGLLYHIDSAKHFIINNASVNDWNKKNYIEFLNRVGRLIKAKENNDYIEIAEIKKIIEEDKAVLFGSWLLEKIDELSDNKRL